MLKLIVYLILSAAMSSHAFSSSSATTIQIGNQKLKVSRSASKESNFAATSTKTTYRSWKVARLPSLFYRTKLGNSVSQSIGDSDVETPTVKNVILFDGVCNFCNTWVDIISGLDKDGRYLYCALQSPNGKLLLGKMGKSPDDLSTVVLVTVESKSLDVKSVYFKSDVPLRVLKSLGIPYSLLFYIGSVFPRGIRDVLYDLVANNRYSFMGKRDSCRLGDML